MEDQKEKPTSPSIWGSKVQNTMHCLKLWDDTEKKNKSLENDCCYWLRASPGTFDSNEQSHNLYTNLCF